MLHVLITVQTSLPGWPQSPSWLHPLARGLGHFLHEHQALGLFLIIFAEELGIPLPAPGDVAIAWGGYLTTTGAIAYPMAYVAVIGGAVTGSLCLYSLSKRFGHPFLLRFGRYIGLHPQRLEKAARAFQRWGPWAIIVGRHIPGMRIVLSAFAGVFEVKARVFVPCVLLSASIWAAIFLEIGRLLGRNSRFLFRLFPTHLFPLLLLLLVAAGLLWVAFERGWRPRSEGDSSRSDGEQDPPPEREPPREPEPLPDHRS
jgi:membrane protein DedA with SNARE-associated domain